MRSKYLLAVLGVIAVGAALWAQEPRGQAPWRGVGPQPCTGPADFGSYKCAPPPEAVFPAGGTVFVSPPPPHAASTSKKAREHTNNIRLCIFISKL